MSRVAGSLLSPLLNQKVQACKEILRLCFRGAFQYHTLCISGKETSGPSCPVLQHYRIATGNIHRYLYHCLYKSVKVCLAKH